MMGVAAVVVTFHPSADALDALIERLRGQVDRVFVIDNGTPSMHPTLVDNPQLTTRRLCRNIGLAAAQNLGLQAAIDSGARFALLLDQDSLPDPAMTLELLTCHAAASATGLRVAAVGPRVLEADGSSEGFVRFRAGRYEAVEPPAGAAWIDCDLVISSGTLLPTEMLAAIGLMHEPLFIDKIDTEWCLRAAAHGCVLLGAPAASLHHRLGERQVRVWFGRWRELALHKPFRYYYMVRNSLLLRQLPHAGAEWKRADWRQLQSLVLYFGLLAPGRGAALAMMWRGLIDGLRRRSGPMN